MSYLRTIPRLLAAALLAGIAFAASAQADPQKSLRWIVSYPPGGGTDFLARTVGAQMAKQSGQPVVIDNRSGGAGAIASDLVARSPADGSTVFTGDNGTLVYNPALFKKLPYDPVKDFAPVGLMARFPLVLLVNVNTPYASAQQLLDAAKARPGALSYASPGIGSPHHLAMELLKQKTGLFILHVPYRGSSSAMQDLMGGQLDMFVADTAAALPMVRSGKLKALAVFSGNRIATLPDAPTFLELGAAGVEAYGWQGMVVPAKTPKDVIARLNSNMVKAIQSPEISSKLVDIGLELIPGDPAAMAKYLESETRVWQKLIWDRKISLD